jgi:glycosyltransferase involved in cell wall biosynthesis
MTEASEAGPLLSICIPTFNRRDAVTRLVRTIMGCPGDFEVRVHIDGSSDETDAALREIDDPRLKVSSGPNRGKHPTLREAFAAAGGRFIMIFDDDDDLFPAGLSAILDDCANGAPQGAAGFIYPFLDEGGELLGGPFPVRRSNLIALRADHRVAGDRKEVVLAELLRAAVPSWMGRYRRTPMSLLWARVAMTHDIICRDEPVGTKRYLAGGITANIRKVKTENSAPMAALHLARCEAFLRGRYRSVGYFLGAITGLSYYTALTAVSRLRRWVGR